MSFVAGDQEILTQITPFSRSEWKWNFQVPTPSLVTVR